MQKTTLLILFTFSSLCLNAQTDLDSLHGIWKDKTKSDSIRIRAFNDYISEGYIYSKPDTALVLADSLFKFTKKKKNIKGNAMALNLIGYAYYMKGEYVEALENYNKSLATRKEINDKKGIAQSLNNMGIIYRRQGDYIRTLDSYQESLKIYKVLDDKLGAAKLLNNIGNVYGDQGDPQSLEYYKRSLKMYEEIESKDGIVNPLNNLGISYAELQDYPKAHEYYQKVLRISEDIGDNRGVAMTINNLGSLYERQKDYNNALIHYEKCLKIVQEIGHKNGIINSLNNIGRVKSALSEYVSAIENCKESYKMAKKMGSLYLQKEASECLYEAYKNLSYNDKALFYHEQMLAFADSLKTEETVKKLQQMEFSKQVLADSLLQVEIDLKEKMAYQTEVQRKNKSKNLALGAGIFFLLLSGGFYSRWRYVKKSKAIIEKEKDRSENLLLNILPSEIAEELKEKGSADAKDFDMVSILFTDFKGFTQASEKLSAKELIEEINHCFIAFDLICETHGIEKIKTIGDSFMAAGGLPVPSEDSIKKTVLAALEMQSFISNRIIEKDELNEMSFKMRLGIHTGPVVAGIVGVKKFQYDIWGDTVNTASRMESSGEIGKVNISEGTYALLKDDPEFTFESRGKIQAKGKGEMEMYFVETKLK
ncbi:MAG: adenylate/guanylate cyclase domain-containing protein [Psychroserpens sp.]|uniref:adenylate/guanylate cyclase domain-containing protein n=1 Tax=Psychroserpens sp. TaxID=2020870 RepID=UPI003000FB5C